MTEREILMKLLLNSSRPIDFFGKIDTEKDLHKKYLKIAHIIHPDTASASEVELSKNAFVILKDLFEKGKKELLEGIYDIKDDLKLYEKKSSLFSLSIKNSKYEFYELKYHGEISDVYYGIKNDKSLVCMKLAIDSADNELIFDEYKLLSSIDHTMVPNLPMVHEYIKINGNSAIIMDVLKGENLTEIMKRNPNGLPVKVVMWIMDRLLSEVGYLHSKYIIHGNIIPENIIINNANHGVSLTGFSFSIQNANDDDAKYKIKNDDFSAPEVSTSAKVLPQSDIFSLGKIAVYLLGGNIDNNGMPISIDIRIRDFIRELLIKDSLSRPNDAWVLWDKWINLRNDIFGKNRFENIKF